MTISSRWRASSLSPLSVFIAIGYSFTAFRWPSLAAKVRQLAEDHGGGVPWATSGLVTLVLWALAIGVLAKDFNRMGARLQSLIGSRRQLLRDVSHELRSPLARLRIALALAERATPVEREVIWPRLAKECDRLEALISEILELARLDADPGAPNPINLQSMFDQLEENARIVSPNQRIDCQVETEAQLQGWPDMLERALDNLLRNALRFNPEGKPIELRASSDTQHLLLSVRDHGPGVDGAHLEQLSEPFFRAPGQTTAGHGLGLAIARRATERHNGELLLGNHPDGGFIATLKLPLNLAIDAPQHA